jgi:hypothetical protein
MGGAISRKVLLSACSFLFLILGGAGQYGLALAKTKVVDENELMVLNIASSILITVFNTIIIQILIITSKK